MTLRYPYIGYGLGLRPVHVETVLSELPGSVDWFEIITEDYLVPGGNPLYYLERFREHYPVVMHGVTLSIGSADPVDWDYLKQLKALADRINPAWISDHLCWSGYQDVTLHDLLPLPHTRDTIDHVVQKVRQVQDFLGRRILLENISSYCAYRSSQMSEWEFLVRVAQEADCLILLDINNIYVNSVNHHFDPYHYLSHVPVERVQQFHLAGHFNCGSHIIDTHDADIIEPVWALYKAAVARFGRLEPVSTMIERDDNIPPLSDLIDELQKAKVVANAVEKSMNQVAEAVE